ncbi:MAG: PqqD family protein [Blastocatellia bacterium]
MKLEADNQQTALARREDLVVQELPDEVLVYDLTQHKAHCLNQTAAFVWNHCDGQTTPAGIAALMEEEWRKPVSEDVVWLALKQLSKADLLQKRAVRQGETVNFSRRDVMRKLGLAAAVTLPMVTSIIAPTAAAAATTPAACQDCVKKINGIGSCPSECTGLILGACYDNSGCGAGQQLTPPASVSCNSCFSGTFSPPPGPGGLTVSWSAPS